MLLIIPSKDAPRFVYQPYPQKPRAFRFVTARLGLCAHNGGDSVNLNLDMIPVITPIPFESEVNPRAGVFVQ